MGSVLRRKIERGSPRDLSRGRSARFAEIGGRWLTSWREVVGASPWVSDLLAGVTVAAVALPLNLALAVACGLPPYVGLVSGAIGGLLAAAFGGAPLQVTGPAAALGVLVLGLVQTYGPAGAAAGALVTGLLQFALFLGLAGKWAARVPEAVLAGFTTGVGLKLLDQQIPLLLDVEHPVTALVTSLHAPEWLRDVNWLAVLCGLFVIVWVLGLSRFKRVPAAILGLGLATFLATYLDWNLNRVGSIPAELPTGRLPELRDAAAWAGLVLQCLPLAVLATAESLLSARAVDRMKAADPSRAKSVGPGHDPDLEILGQSLANVGVGLAGGMPVSGVVVRSSVNVQSGGRTRLSALVHGALLLAAPLLISGTLAQIPIAALAGLLCVVGFRLVELHTFAHLARESRVHAVAFAVAAAGVATGELTLGLLAAIGIAALSDHGRRRDGVRSDGLRRAALGMPAGGADGAAPGTRAVIAHPPGAVGGARAAAEIYRFPAPGERWDRHVEAEARVHPSAFVHPNASVIGEVWIGPSAHVAAEAALRADEGTPFHVGRATNVQDGVVLHALKSRWIEVDGRRWAIYVGDHVSLAHQALIHGPCYVGSRSFVGFKAVVHDAVLGEGCFVGIGAVVVGVEVPPGRFVPNGMIVDRQEIADGLGPVGEAQRHFNEDVVEVNQGLAQAYRAQGEESWPAEAAKASRVTGRARARRGLPEF